MKCEKNVGILQRKRSESVGPPREDAEDGIGNRKAGGYLFQDRGDGTKPGADPRVGDKNP